MKKHKTQLLKGRLWYNGQTVCWTWTRMIHCQMSVPSWTLYGIFSSSLSLIHFTWSNAFVKDQRNNNPMYAALKNRVYKCGMLHSTFLYLFHSLPFSENQISPHLTITILYYHFSIVFDLSMGKQRYIPRLTMTDLVTEAKTLAFQSSPQADRSLAKWNARQKEMPIIACLVHTLLSDAF